jgi:pimeloyl-ACP methyl ester carboxylesterase
MLPVLFAAGCATKVIHPEAQSTVIVVPGIGGDGPDYAQVTHALRDAGDNDCLQVFEWGLHMPLFFITISDKGIHDRTEQRLLARVTAWRTEHPGSRIVLIGHSAGAGVVLGMLARMEPNQAPIGPVILLAPAVSPKYDLTSALRRVTVMHVFFSQDDGFWQGFGPTVFGGYDGFHGNGAGRLGFVISTFNKDEQSKLVQHPFDPRWNKLGNHGGHFDSLSPDFVQQVLKPLIDAPTTRTSTPPQAQTAHESSAPAARTQTGPPASQ